MQDAGIEALACARHFTTSTSTSIQPVVKPVVQPSLTIGSTNSGCSFNTVVKHGCLHDTTGLTTVASCKRGMRQRTTATTSSVLSRAPYLVIPLIFIFLNSTFTNGFGLSNVKSILFPFYYCRYLLFMFK